MPSGARSKKSLLERGASRLSRPDSVDAWVCGLSAHLPPAPVSPAIIPSQLEPVGEIPSVELTSTAQKASHSSWADEVEEELFSGKVPDYYEESSLASEPLEIIEGIKYKYSAGSRPPLLFSPDVPDARYQYEGEPAATASPSSDASDFPRWANMNAHYATTKPTATNNYQKPKTKARKKNKKHTQPTPVICSEEDFYEAQAAEDPVEGILPTVDRILEPVESAPVVEDLWAEYKKRRPLPLRVN